MKLLLTLIGLVMLVEGIPYFTMPHRAKEMARFIVDAEPAILRIIGFALMCGGLVFIAIIRLWIFPE